METLRYHREKPFVVLVYGFSVLRLWMERSLSNWFQLRIFSNAEDALFYVRSATILDILVIDLELVFSKVGDCNIA